MAIEEAFPVFGSGLKVSGGPGRGGMTMDAWDRQDEGGRRRSGDRDPGIGVGITAGVPEAYAAVGGAAVAGPLAAESTARL